MPLRHRLSMLALALFLAGCESQPRPVITRRYLEARFLASARAGEHATVSAFVIDTPRTPVAPDVPPAPACPPVPPPADPSKGTAPPPPSPAPLPASATPFFAEAVDRTLVRRRLVFSVLKTDAVQSPAARLDHVTMTVDLLPEQTKWAAFESWSRFQTETGSVELGDLTLKQTRSTVSSIEAGPYTEAKFPVSGGVQHTATNEQNESVKLTQRYVKLGGALSRTAAQLYQEGALGIDLVGTSLVDVEVRLAPDTSALDDVYKFHALYRDGKPILPADVTFSLARFTIPAAATTADGFGALRGRLGGTYRLRLAAEGDSTIMEGDDRADYVRGTLGAPAPAGSGTLPRATQSTSNEVELLSPEQLRGLRSAYRVRHRRAGTADEDTLHLEGSPSRLLLFENREEGEAWLAWLRLATPKSVTEIRIGPYRLTFGDGTAVTPSHFGALFVRRWER